MLISASETIFGKNKTDLRQTKLFRPAGVADTVATKSANPNSLTSNSNSTVALSASEKATLLELEAILKAPAFTSEEK